jgi:hypothetical protein
MASYGGERYLPGPSQRLELAAHCLGQVNGVAATVTVLAVIAVAVVFPAHQRYARQR